MIKCSLCGQEDLFKPKYVKKFIRTDYDNSFKSMELKSIPFGSFCYKKNKKGCENIANEIIKTEIIARDLKKYNEKWFLKY